MSLLSKLTLGAAAVLGAYALKPRRATKGRKAGSASSPGPQKPAAGRAAKKRRPAKSGARPLKARTRSRSARRASAK